MNISIALHDEERTVKYYTGPSITKADLRTQRRNLVAAFRSWYYGLPKAIPGAGGNPVVAGYDGTVVRYDGRDIHLKDVMVEFDKRVDTLLATLGFTETTPGITAYQIVDEDNIQGQLVL